MPEFDDDIDFDEMINNIKKSTTLTKDQKIARINNLA
jgi:hypothetical protein